MATKEYTFGLNDTSKSIYVSAWTVSTGARYTAGAYNTSGIEAWYRLQGASSAETQVGSTGALVTQTATGAWTSGGFVVSKFNRYRFDIPNALLAAVGQHELSFGGVTDVEWQDIKINVMGGDPYSTDATFMAAMADTFLNRDMSTGTDSGSTTVRTPRQALRAMRNKVAVAGTALTVYKEDDSTASWTGVVTGTPAVTIVDPA